MELFDVEITFDDRRNAKWRAGALKYRGSLTAPFQDDPVLEALGETPDLANYIDEAIRQGRIPEHVGRELIREVASIDAVLVMYR